MDVLPADRRSMPSGRCLVRCAELVGGVWEELNATGLNEVAWLDARASTIVGAMIRPAATTTGKICFPMETSNCVPPPILSAGGSSALQDFVSGAGTPPPKPSPARAGLPDRRGIRRRRGTQQKKICEDGRLIWNHDRITARS